MQRLLRSLHEDQTREMLPKVYVFRNTHGLRYMFQRTLELETLRSLFHALMT